MPIAMLRVGHKHDPNSNNRQPIFVGRRAFHLRSLRAQRKLQRRIRPRARRKSLFEHIDSAVVCCFHVTIAIQPSYGDSHRAVGKLVPCERPSRSTRVYPPAIALCPSTRPSRYKLSSICPGVPSQRTCPGTLKPFEMINVIPSTSASPTSRLCVTECSRSALGTIP